MMENQRTRVCPVELAPSLDSWIRRWLQNPQKILSPYVKPGMTVLDVGCGPGFFSVEMARMVGPDGRVISADLQEGMLQKLAARVRGTALESRIQLVECGRDSIHVSERVNFILTFYMVHEVPDKVSLFRQLKDVLKPDGQVLLVEPKLFHVSGKEFDATLRIAEGAGFRVTDGPGLPLSWSAVLTNR